MLKLIKSGSKDIYNVTNDLFQYILLFWTSIIKNPENKLYHI